MKDKVDKKVVRIEYCPTTLMLADYFTKALQGNVFRRFRDVIMGYTHINDLLLDPGFLLKERVEKLNNIVIKKSETKNEGSLMTYASIVKRGSSELVSTGLVKRGNSELVPELVSKKEIDKGELKYVEQLGVKYNDVGIKTSGVSK